MISPVLNVHSYLCIAKLAVYVEIKILLKIVPRKYSQVHAKNMPRKETKLFAKKKEEK